MFSLLAVSVRIMLVSAPVSNRAMAVGPIGGASSQGFFSAAKHAMRASTISAAASLGFFSCWSSVVVSFSRLVCPVQLVFLNLHEGS